MPSEFDLIARYFARPTPQAVLGPGDDCALIAPASGMELAITTDMLVSGTHFLPETDPFQLGWKTLAVNISDLAAMGARPRWVLLAGSLPDADESWIAQLADGLFSCARRFAVDLIGGDTTRGPLSIAVTAMGLVEPGRALRRDGARVGDEVWVTGTLGDAAGGLALLDREPVPALRARLDRPTPRVAAGRALAGIATACVDVSDGLLADLGHVCARSHAAAHLDVDALPASAALREAFGEADRIALQASGGDDYELCFTAPADAGADIGAVSAQLGLRITRIGRIVVGEGVHPVDAKSQPWSSPRRGYDHFAEH